MKSDNNRKAALYFHGLNAELCHPLHVHKDQMEMEGETERTLFRAKAMPTRDVFWCSEFMECFATGQWSCGKECSSYEPRNGRSGRCIFHGPCYEPDHNEVKVLKLPVTTQTH